MDEPKLFELQSELQSWFSNIITSPLSEYNPETLRQIEQVIRPSANLSPWQRIDIYREQYWWRLFGLMQKFYPTLARLFGSDDFNALIAEPYLRRYPPTDWFIPSIALHLPQWLDECYHEPDRPLVYQVALIDEAYERLFHAPMFPPLEKGVPNVALQPAIELFHLTADLFTFREKFLEQEPDYWQKNDFPDIETEKSPYFFVLFRLSDAVCYADLSREEYQQLSALRKGMAIEEAHLEKWLRLGWLIGDGSPQSSILNWRPETSTNNRLDA